MLPVPSPELPPKPNIVLVFCDDAGYGDFGFTGNPVIRTPNLDRLAREGAVLTQFYTPSPACTASRYSLLTGKYPARSGFSWVLVPGSPRYLHPKETTIAEMLKARGYRTGMFGKWHLGYPNEKNAETTDALPLAHGFDEWVGFAYSNDMRPETNWPDIHLISGPHTQANMFGLYRSLGRNPDQRQLTHLYTDRALRFIDQSGDQPFFAYIPYAMPHLPLFPGADFAGRSARGTYGDVMEEIDHHVGRIADHLRRRGIADETLLIFTSDNGPWIIKGREGGSSGPFRDGKGSTWEGGVRMPAIFHWPGSIAPRRQTAGYASTLDIFATAADMSGAAKGSTDGRSLLPVLTQGKALPTKPLPLFGTTNKPFALRSGPWKLHVTNYSQTGEKHFEGLPLLFNLETDPGETKPLKDEAVRDRLLKELDQINNEIAEAGNLWAD